MQIRVKLVPMKDGTRVVFQHKFMGLFWRDLKPATNRRYKAMKALMDSYVAIHNWLSEIEKAEKEEKRLVQEVYDYGDPLRGTGIPFTVSGKEMAQYKRERFIPAPPAKEFKKVEKAIREGTFHDPLNINLQWPPPDMDRPTPGGTRSAYVFDRFKLKALTSGIEAGLERWGKPADHIVGYQKPQPKQQQQNQSKRKGGGNQQQDNSGGNSN